MHDTPEFRLEFKNLTPALIDSLPKVLLHSTAPLSSLAHENAVYVEHVVDFSELDAAIEQASQAPFTVALLVRCRDESQVRSLVSDSSAIVVGVLVDDLAAANAARELYLPFVVEESLATQVATGAPRLVNALELFDDFRINEDGEILLGRLGSWIRDRDTALVCDPLGDLASGDVDTLADHPLELLRSLGFNAVATGLDTALLSQLVDQLGLTLEDIFELTVAALDAAFLAKPLREKLFTEQLLPAFEPYTIGEATKEEEKEPEESEDVDLSGIDPFMLEQFGIDPDDLKK